MLAPPQVLLVGRRGAEPTLAIFFIKSDLAHRRIDEPGQVLRHQGQSLVEVDRAGDRLAHVGDELELAGVALRLFVKPCHLNGHRELSRRRAQGLDLTPVGAALVGAVVADLEHAGRPPGNVAAERHEDPDQVFVLAALEDLACQRERRGVIGMTVVLFADQARQDLA